MSGTIFTSTAARGLKETIEEIVTDPALAEPKIMPKWCYVRNMTDNYEDDYEIGGPGLAAEKAEGAEIKLGTIAEGYITRYQSRTIALRMAISEEMMEDSKYPKIVDMAKRLPRAIAKTIEVDSSLMLARAADTNYPGGDGQPLASASHTLPHGGTFSNTLSTPLSPSRAALTVVRTACLKLPSQDGITEGYDIKKIACPVDQWETWRVIVGSAKAPEAGEFNAINVYNDMGLEVVPNKYWNNTTTNWGVITEADHGLCFKWRRKPRSRSWVENSHEVMYYSRSCRISRGWSDPRGFYFSNI